MIPRQKRRTMLFFFVMLETYGRVADKTKTYIWWQCCSSMHRGSTHAYLATPFKTANLYGRSAERHRTGC